DAGADPVAGRRVLPAGPARRDLADRQAIAFAVRPLGLGRDVRDRRPAGAGQPVADVSAPRNPAAGRAERAAGRRLSPARRNQTMTMLRTLCGALALCALLLAPRALPAQAAAGLHAVEAAQRALPRAPRLPRTAFLENRNLADVQLSPNGDFVAYLREQKDSRALWLLPTNGGKAR